jgi:hypothetical protein
VTTSTTKRRTAQEWLIFLLCLAIGIFATYFAFYFGERVSWQIYDPGVESQWVWIHKYKNPGDLFNDLTSGQNAQAPYPPLTLWLCVLSPYFAFWFVRSIIWSVNALRRS